MFVCECQSFHLRPRILHENKKRVDDYWDYVSLCVMMLKELDHTIARTMADFPTQSFLNENAALKPDFAWAIEAYEKEPERGCIYK